MPDPKKINMMWSLGGGGNFAFDLPVIDGGVGGHGLLELSFPELDEATTLALALSASNLETVGKLRPYADTDVPGTYTLNNQWKIGLRWGFKNRGKFATTDSGRPWFAFVTGRQSGVAPGWIKLQTPDQTIGGGKKYAGSSDTWYTVTLTKESNLAGFEFSPSPDWHITPELGLITSATYAFVSKDEFQERQFSAQGLQLYVRINVGYGQTGSKVTRKKELTGLQIGRHFSQELHSICYDWILFDRFKRPQAEALEPVEEIFGGGGGMGGGSMWLAPTLIAASAALEAGTRIDPVSYHLRAPSWGWKIPGMVLEAGKAAGYSVAGMNGDAEDVYLLTPGFASLNNLATMGISETGIPEKYLFLAPYVIGGAQILFSGLFDNPKDPVGVALMNAGTLTAGGWTQNPERGRKEFLESTSYSFSPISNSWGGNLPGISGGFRMRNHFSDSIFFTEFGIISPALMITNLGNLGINSLKPRDEENPYKDVETPNFLMSTFGVEEDFAAGETVYFNLGAGLSMVTQIDAVSQKGGAGLSGNVGMGLWLNSKKSIAIEVGAAITAFKTRDDWGVALAPALGVNWGD